MFYIKLEDDLSLVITERDVLRRGDNLSKKVIYLVPQTVGELDPKTAFFYLNYIRADGIADIVMLERMEDMYNETYYQFTFPITCKLTRFPGSVCTWMQIYDGSMSDPMVAKSGECILQIEDSKNMDDYVSDRIVTALYQYDKKVADGFADANGRIDDNADAIMQNSEAIAQNADAIAQNSDAISQNATAIAQNSDAIMQNIDAINALNSALDNTNSSVAQNAEDIANAQMQIAENTEDISAHTNDIAELRTLVANKADSLIFHSEDSSIQLTADGTPIGARIVVNADGKLISVQVSEDAGNAIELKADGLYVPEHENIDVPEYEIEKQGEADDGFSATYKLKRTLDGESSYVGAKINIPKDLVVESGELKTVDVADEPYEGASVGDKYIDLVIANAANDHIYIPVNDLVDTYTAGDGIVINNNVISIVNKTDRELNGANGKALIFNESDGGGAKFEHSDGTWSFVGVNDGGENGITGQIYTVKRDAESGKYVGTRLNMTKSGFFYTANKNSSAFTAADEIATKGDIAAAALEWGNI